MCIGRSQCESLVFIAIAGIVAAVLLPSFQAANAHLGWPGWVVLPFVGIGTVVGTFVVTFGFLLLSEFTDRIDAWRQHRRGR